MNKRNMIRSIAACFGMLLLILDGRTALAGMREGLDICLSVLIPSLFPFFLLSTLLVGALSGASLPLLRPLGRLLGIPSGSEQLLVIGALGGYPVGAQNIAVAHRTGQLSREDAARMLAFCSNAGPSFIFGMVAPLFSDWRLPWLLWAVQLGSALLVGMTLPGRSRADARINASKEITLPQALEQALRAMALVCGWVILFRLVLAFLDRWVFWAFPKAAVVLLSGLLELSNGCIRLLDIPSDSLRFLLASVMLSFGGCCVGLQTISVCGALPWGKYFLGKLMQAGYALLLATGILVHPVSCVIPFLLVLLLKKRSSNWAPVGV